MEGVNDPAGSHRVSGLVQLLIHPRHHTGTGCGSEFDNADVWWPY